MCETPRVVYSIGAKFAGGGIGTTAYYGARGLYRHGMLHRVLCGSFRPSDIPRSMIRSMGLVSRVMRRLALYDRTRRLALVHDVLYDLWASLWVAGGTMFHVWGGYGLRSLRRAQSQGMMTIVQWASSHPSWRISLLEEEYRRWGLTFHVPATTHRRTLAEMARADYVLIPSPYVRATFRAHRFPEEKLLQVEFGVDTERFRPGAREGKRPFRVLYVGTVTLGKGVPYLLEAWKRLGWQDAELWVVGRVSAEMPPLLRAYREVPGIRFLGHQRDIARIYGQADIFAFPSIDEGSALVTYEALACGLPVVTTPNAGSVVRDGVEGLIVPIRDVDALAAALERLREDEGLRRNLSVNARRRAETYTWRRHGERLAQIYAALQGEAGVWSAAQG